MVDDLNKYCLAVKKKNKNWHPDALFVYLEAAKFTFLPMEYWRFYHLDRQDFQFKFNEGYMDFQV